MSTPAGFDPTASIEQMRELMDKTIQRSVKGLDFVRAGRANVGMTPKDLIYDEGTLKLYHYRPQTDEIYRIPIIIVMATTNKGFVFDLIPGQSMVEYLVKAGFDVFMIDWDPPMMQERGLGLADYTHRFLPAALKKCKGKPAKKTSTSSPTARAACCR